MSTLLYGNSKVKVYSTKEVVKSLQPAFSAFMPSTTNNVTGNSVLAYLGWPTALTEIFDQNADFNVNGTFTAPITGRYHITCQIIFYGAWSRETELYIVTSNRTYTSDRDLPGDEAVFQGQAIADMDVGDTCQCEFKVIGGLQDVDVLGHATIPYCFMMGYLIC